MPTENLAKGYYPQFYTLSEEALSTLAEMIPEHMQGAVKRYVEEGIHPGDFLTSVIEHELFVACAVADNVNRHHLFEYACWFHNHAPGLCHGGKERMEAWIEAAYEWRRSCKEEGES